MTHNEILHFFALLSARSAVLCFKATVIHCIVCSVQYLLLIGIVVFLLEARCLIRLLDKIVGLSFVLQYGFTLDA